MSLSLEDFKKFVQRAEPLPGIFTHVKAVEGTHEVVFYRTPISLTIAYFDGDVSQAVNVVDIISRSTEFMYDNDAMVEFNMQPEKWVTDAEMPKWWTPFPQKELAANKWQADKRDGKMLDTPIPLDKLGLTATPASDA